MEKPRSRPVYLDLLSLRFPPQAVTSIAHRISGVLLFLALPLLLLTLELSLSDEGFGQVAVFFESRWVHLLLLPLLWAGFHHLFAGLRCLLIDVGIGVDRPAGRRSALWISWSALAVALLVWVSLW